MPTLFVHGTLRQGGSNSGLIAGAALTGTGETSEQYALYIIGGSKPVVTKRPVSTIKGEVYDVTEEMLLMVDRLQNHPRINQRELVGIRLKDGTSVEAWMYFHTQPLRNSVLVESGDFTTHKP